MKSKLWIINSVFVILYCLCGCSPVSEKDISEEIPEEKYYIQEIAHLHLEDTLEMLSDTESIPIRAVWIPVMVYSQWMENQSETAFRSYVRTAFQNCADLGLNTVYLHVRAYCDAYYPSELFPKGAYLTGNYDALEIMTEEAHAQGLAVHAWINPMRGQTAAQLANTDEKYILRQWYEDADKNGSYLVQYSDRYYLNPAYPEVRQLIADGITEILENYDVDGIHIDDYFYPTTDESFDRQAFAESNAENLSDWRRNNCSELVALLYQTVKKYDKIFSISPQGNFDTNYYELYADVKLWCSTEGYCDVIIPQLYYGFDNETCPFAEMLKLWEEAAEVPDLVIGLAVYKIGLEDEWAGSGRTEWMTDSAVISKQLTLVNASETADGVALYSYSSVFMPETSVSELIESEKSQIAEAFQQ